MPFNDGMPSTQILSVQFSGTNVEATNVSGANVEISAGGISTAELADAGVTSAKIGSGAVMTVNLSGGQVTAAVLASESVTVPKQAFVGTGSPAVWGNGVQFGTGTLGAGSSVWVVFTPAFKAIPNVVVSNRNSSAINIIGTGSGTDIGVGSVFVLGTTAATTFNWIAAGSM